MGRDLARRLELRGGPSLITSYAGTPTPYGAAYRAHLLALGVPVRPHRHGQSRWYPSYMSFLDRALRMGEAKKFKSYEQRVARINAYEPEMESSTDEELRELRRRAA